MILTISHKVCPFPLSSSKTSVFGDLPSGEAISCLAPGEKGGSPKSKDFEDDSGGGESGFGEALQ